MPSKKQELKPEKKKRFLVPRESAKNFRKFFIFDESLKKHRTKPNSQRKEKKKDPKPRSPHLNPTSVAKKFKAILISKDESKKNLRFTEKSKNLLSAIMENKLDFYCKEIKKNSSKKDKKITLDLCKDVYEKNFQPQFGKI